MTTARTMPDSCPGPRLFVAADICTPGGAQQVIDRAGERFGVLDILIHTAGGSHASSGGFADFARRSRPVLARSVVTTRPIEPAWPTRPSDRTEPVQW
jgi:NAD(P)-dependent dehydrogenase (short-subunit alcohol dehydrogenase family)